MYTHDNFQIFMKIYTICNLSVGSLFYNPFPVYFHVPFVSDPRVSFLDNSSLLLNKNILKSEFH